MFKSISFLTDNSVGFVFTYPIHKFQKGKLPQDYFIQAVQKMVSTRNLSPDVLHDSMLSDDCLLGTSLLL